MSSLCYSVIVNIVTFSTVLLGLSTIVYSTNYTNIISLYCKKVNLNDFNEVENIGVYGTLLENIGSRNLPICLFSNPEVLPILQDYYSLEDHKVIQES